jgi:hypothetical protein
MGLDQKDDKPIVDLHKKTTRVNVSIVIGVVVFIIGALAIMLILNHS